LKKSRREKPCTHAGAISANRDCARVGGCDTDEERRRLFAGRWGVPVYSDAGEMIRCQSPRLLVIATHPDSHYRYCHLAAKTGVPVVSCEKPLVDSLSAARKIAAVSAAPGTRGTVIMTNHERRYSADYIRARELLAEGKLGALLSVRAVLYMGKNKRLLDVFWHDGGHLADAIMFLTGRVLKHRRRWGAKLSASSGTAWLEGRLLPQEGDRPEPRETPVLMEIGAGRDHLVFELEFSCSAGRLRIGNGIFEVWESDESPYAEKFRSLKKTAECFEGPTGYFANMIADAVSRIHEPACQPVSSAEDGLRVIEYLHSVKRWR
jgi:predicted dehydrogenase